MHLVIDTTLVLGGGGGSFVRDIKFTCSYHSCVLEELFTTIAEEFVMSRRDEGPGTLDTRFIN